MRVADETYEHAISLFKSGMLMKEVELQVGVSNVSIYKWAKKKGIEISNQHGRKNHFNQHFFQIIDTEEKAYWLGFIYADGCVTKVSKKDKQANRMVLNLSAVDYQHLVKFTNTLESNVKVIKYQPHSSTYSSNLMCRLVLNSVVFARHLINHGVIESKTNFIRFPYYSMKPSLYRHFIRGYFDGDGMISTGGKTSFGKFSIISTYSFCKSIQDILIKEIGINKTKFSPEKGDMFSMRYGGPNNLIKIYNYLYKDASVYLQRKYEKYNLLLLNRNKELVLKHLRKQNGTKNSNA